jgi:hypothetical protein
MRLNANLITKEFASKKLMLEVTLFSNGRCIVLSALSQTIKLITFLATNCSNQNHTLSIESFVVFFASREIKNPTFFDE